MSNQTKAKLKQDPKGKHLLNGENLHSMVSLGRGFICSEKHKRYGWFDKLIKSEKYKVAAVLSGKCKNPGRYSITANIKSKRKGHQLKHVANVTLNNQDFKKKKEYVKEAISIIQPVPQHGTVPKKAKELSIRDIFE